MIQLNNRFRDYTFVLLITVSSAFVAACGGGGGGGGGDSGGNSVQVGSGTRTIDELTGDAFVTPEPIFASGTSKLGDRLRYYPWDNESEYESFIYRSGGTALWYRESADGGPSYEDFNEEYRLVARDEDAFPTDIASNALAFAGYNYLEEGDTALDDADLFALEGEYAAALGWYTSDSLQATVGLATPVSSLPDTGSAVWRGKAIGAFIVGEPTERTNQFSRVLRDDNGVRGGDGMRYFVEGDITVSVDFSSDDVDGRTILRAYEEPTNGRAYLNYLIDENDGIATRDEDVVGTLNLDFDGDLDRIDGEDHYAGYVNNLRPSDNGVFGRLVTSYNSNQLMHNYFQGSLYGPNFEETAGDLRISACSETPIYAANGDFESCGGDLHFLGVGFVLSTIPVPIRGDTLAEALDKLGLDATTEEDGAYEIVTTDDVDEVELETDSLSFASFGEWEQTVSGISVSGFLYFSDNQVSELPTSGMATYDDLTVKMVNFADDIEAEDETGGSLVANFGTNEITGMLSIDEAVDGEASAITMIFTNGSIADDTTFSGDLTVSDGPTGAFANINTGSNGEFSGAFYDSSAYDASTTPAEVAGTFDSVMDSEGKEWGGGFIGD